MRNKYNRPDKIPHILVPTVNGSIYRKLSRFQKDNDHCLQKTQGNLCGGIYTTAALSEKLCQLKKDNPGDELFAELHAVSEDALFLLVHVHFSFQLSSAKRGNLKHLSAWIHNEKCKKSSKVTDELFGSKLSKVCRDISEASRSTIKMLKIFYIWKELLFFFLSRRIPFVKKNPKKLFV